MGSAPPTMSGYRADIDGLRAVAVLSVLLYHLEVGAISGGYVGVDIFFVISGFLISRLLLQEHVKCGTIDFGQFYLRRINRIVPALLFTLSISSIAAISLFTPNRLLEFGQSLLHATLSVSNVLFFSQSGYFDSSAELKPLLHTWSLGVEEQFYLIWPLVVSILLVRKGLFAIGVFAITVLSFCLASIFVDTHASAVFYLMPFRVFEFGIGAALLFLRPAEASKQIYLNCLLVAGVCLIVFSVTWFDNTSQFPGVNALIPCLGAALCIYSSENALFGSFLRSRVLVGIGAISYSLYLIHWPLIVFYKYYLEKQQLLGVDVVVLALAALLLAVVMYRYIEQPFRNGQLKPYHRYTTLILASFVLCYIGASIWGTSGWSWRAWSTGVYSAQEVKQAKAKRFTVRQKICSEKGWTECDNPVAGKISALVIGDSQSVDALNAMHRVLPLHDFSMSELGGCPPYADVRSLFPKNHLNLNKCVSLNKIRHDVAYLEKYDYLVINALYRSYTLDHLASYLSFLHQSGIEHVVVVGGYATLKEEMSELLNRYGRAGFDPNSYLEENAYEDQQYRKLVESYGFFYLSAKNAFCSDGDCRYFSENGTPFTFDKHHLSFEFGSELAVNDARGLQDYLAPLNSSRRKSASIDIVEWGPKSTYLNTNPNALPDGSMGIWIKVHSDQALDDVIVNFDGKAALITHSEPGLITAAVSMEQVSTIGAIAVTIVRQDDGKPIGVGEFTVLSK